MAALIIVLFGLSVIIAALLSSRSLKKVTNEKLVLTAYENAYTLSNNIESSYSQTLGFAGSSAEYFGIAAGVPTASNR